jgi:hypothetical protein
VTARCPQLPNPPVPKPFNHPPDSRPCQDLNVNRIKMIKRQMYGRVKLDLLRKRILLAA